MAGRRGRFWCIGLAVGLMGLAAFFHASGWQDAAGQALPACPAGRPILLDPGHGGIDGGANVPGMLEKEIVLDIALRTARYLEHYKVPVLLTRTADVDLGGAHDSGRLRRDLIYRIRVANHCRAALMLSLHVNSARAASERGMMLFYQASRPSRDAAGLLADVLRRWPVHSRAEPPYARDFAVLRWSKAPAVLVELGFITNAQDRLLLADSAYREEVARALASACVAIYHQWMKQGGL